MGIFLKNKLKIILRIAVINIVLNCILLFEDILFPSYRDVTISDKRERERERERERGREGGQRQRQRKTKTSTIRY